MPKVNLSNGDVLNFPEGMTEQQMQAEIAKEYPEYAKNWSQHKKGPNDAFRYGLIDPLLGLEHLGSKFAEVIGHKKPYRELEKRFNLPEEQQNLADRLLQMSPEIAASLAIPEARLGRVGEAIATIPKAGKFLHKAATAGVSQALLASLLNPEHPISSGIEAAAISGPLSAVGKLAAEGSPGLRKVAKLGLGLGAADLAHKGASIEGIPEVLSLPLSAAFGYFGYHGVNPKSAASSDVLKGVEGTSYKENLEAARRLGLNYLTPAEASQNPFVGSVQGSLGKTPAGAQILYNAGKERLGSEENSIKNLFDTIFKESELGAKKNKLYENAYKESVPHDFMSAMNKNEIIKHAQNKVANEPAFKESLKGTRVDSVKYWDHVKQALDDMIQAAPRKEAGIIKSTQKELVNKLDEVAPEYKEARGLAEREIARRNLEEEFKKKEFSGINMFNVMKDKTKFDTLQNNLRNAPDAQKKLQDMRQIFGNLINPPSVRTASQLERTNMPKPRSALQALETKLFTLANQGRYDKAAIELITNPKWDVELEKLKNPTNKEKALGKLIEMLGKAGGQQIAK